MHLRLLCLCSLRAQPGSDREPSEGSEKTQPTAHGWQQKRSLFAAMAEMAKLMAEEQQQQQPPR